MLETAIAYTATLLKYVANITGNELRMVADVVGETGISRLIHNAPMNQLLPLAKIAGEVIHDYDLQTADRFPAEPDTDFGKTAAQQTVAQTETKWEYGACLLAVLTKTE